MIIHGTVIKGDGIAGKLYGTPTANLVVDNLPAVLQEGVYSGTATVDGVVYNAAIYFVDPKKKFEVHLLDFSGDLVGKTLDVAIGQRVSGHVAWESEEQMRVKIADDLQKIRKIL